MEQKTKKPRQKNWRISTIEKWAEKPTKDVRTFIIREQAALTRLLKIFPNEDFWKEASPDYKVKSLCWYQSGRGRDELDRKYKKFGLSLTSTQTVDITVSEEKFGEDISFKPKFRKIKDLFKS